MRKYILIYLIFFCFSANSFKGIAQVNVKDSLLSVCSSLSSGFLVADSIGSKYQWRLNTRTGFADITDTIHYKGINSDTLWLINLPSSSNGYQYQCMIDSSSGNTIFNLQFENKWTGSVDSTWENPLNWSCGVLPDSNTNVFIDSGSVVLNSNTAVKSIEVNPNASLTIKAPNNLTITANTSDTLYSATWTVNGTTYKGITTVYDSSNNGVSYDNGDLSSIANSLNSIDVDMWLRPDTSQVYYALGFPWIPPPSPFNICFITLDYEGTYCWPLDGGDPVTAIISGRTLTVSFANVDMTYANSSSDITVGILSGKLVYHF